MAKTIRRNRKKVLASGGEIADRTSRRRKKRQESGGRGNDLFSPSNFILPQDFNATYIHSYTSNFHRGIKELETYATLDALFKTVTDKMKANIEDMKKMFESSYKNFSSEDKKEILDYFSEEEEVLNDLRFIKDTLKLVEMALSGKELAYKTRTGEIRYYLSVEGMELSQNTAVAERVEDLEVQIIKRLASSNQNMLNEKELKEIASSIVRLAEAVANNRSTAKNNRGKNDPSSKKPKEKAQAKYSKWVDNEAFRNINDISGGTIMEKLKNMLASWSKTYPEYRQGSYAHLIGLSSFKELLALGSRDQDFGFLAEVLRANAYGGAVTGDEDNTKTTADIKYTIKLADSANVVIRESLKFLKNDIYSKPEDFTTNNLKNLLGGSEGTALAQLNYFLSNYFILGQAEAEGKTFSNEAYVGSSQVVEIYDLILKFLKIVAFYAAVYQGGAKNALASSNKLPILLTVNKRTIFTYELWDLMERAFNGGLDASILATGELKNTGLTGKDHLAIKKEKSEVTSRYNKKGEPYDYSAYLEDSKLMSSMKSKSYLNRSAAMAKITVSINMAQIMNN